MSKRNLAQHVVCFEALAFLVMLLFLWLNEVADLPSVLFGAPATPINWVESLFESILVVALAVLTILLTRRFLARIRLLEGFLQVCAACKRIRVEDEWVPFDVFLRDHSEAAISHGLCPHCARQFEKGIPARAC